MILIIILFLALGIIAIVIAIHLVIKEMNTAQFSMSPSGATKLHVQGWSFKDNPLSTMEDPEINLEANMIISSGGIFSTKEFTNLSREDILKKVAPRTYETDDGIIHLRWAAPLRPLIKRLANGKIDVAPSAEYLQNLILNTPAGAALMALGDIEVTLSDKLAKTPNATILKDKKAIAKFIAEVFQGRVITEKEKEMGLEVLPPSMYSLDLGERSQAAMDRLQENKIFLKSLADYKDEAMDEKAKAEMTLIATGVVKKTVEEKKFTLEGIPEAIRDVAAQAEKAAESFFNRKKS